MENLTKDQMQLLLILFRIQNSEKDLTDFVKNFGKEPYIFSKVHKIKDLKLKEIPYGDVSLVATDDEDYDWNVIIASSINGFNIKQRVIVGGMYIPFDIMNYISLEDKV